MTFRMKNAFIALVFCETQRDMEGEFHSLERKIFKQVDLLNSFIQLSGLYNGSCSQV